MSVSRYRGGFGDQCPPNHTFGGTEWSRDETSIDERVSAGRTKDGVAKKKRKVCR